MRQRFRHRPGLTAIEVVITAGFFSIFCVSLLSLFSTGLIQYQRGTGKGDADNRASLYSQSVVKDIENGKSATTNSGLTVQLPGLNDQGDYDTSLNGDLIHYYVSNGSLYRQVNGGTAGDVVDGVQAFTPTISGNTITFTLTISIQSGTITSQTSFTQVVTLRNYVGP